jgi:hypothetical protein
VLLDAVLRDFPDLQVVLAHGGRGWWYDAAAFLAVSRPNVWIELSGLPPKRLPEYYSRFDLGRLARKWIYGTDWPGVPGQAANARAVASLGLPEDVVSGSAGRPDHAGEAGAGRQLPAVVADLDAERRDRLLHTEGRADRRHVAGRSRQVVAGVQLDAHHLGAGPCPQCGGIGTDGLDQTARRPTVQ